MPRMKPRKSFDKDPNRVLDCHVLGTCAAGFLFLGGFAVCLLRTRGSWKRSIRLRVPKSGWGRDRRWAWAPDLHGRKFGGTSTNVLSASAYIPLTV